MTKFTHRFRARGQDWCNRRAPQGGAEHQQIPLRVGGRHRRVLSQRHTPLPLKGPTRSAPRLSSGEKFVPYRNNKLTLLMQDSATPAPSDEGSFGHYTRHYRPRRQREDAHVRQHLPRGLQRRRDAHIAELRAPAQRPPPPSTRVPL